VTTTQKSMRTMKENNTVYDTDDTAIVSMEKQTSMNGTELSVGCW
jgi:hypothetical protein